MPTNAYSFIITPMLDEMDGLPCFEVTADNGNFATNVTRIEDAFDIIRQNIQPAQSLESMAKNWIIQNGTSCPDGIREDVEREFEIKFTEDQWDSFCNMLTYSKITVEFPYGFGVPPTE